MCSTRRTESLQVNLSDSFPYADEETRRGCPPTLASDARLMLRLLADGHHGTTALEGLFMSSPEVATYCSAGTWQCEYDFKGYKNLIPDYLQYWDVQKKLVWFDKGPRGRCSVISKEYGAFEQERKESDILMQHGINELKYAYVLNWRPVCLSLLSSLAREQIKNDPKEFARKESNKLQALVQGHKFVMSRGIPILVTNLADMLWSVEQSKARLANFLPCVGDLDFNSVPQLGKDIFPSNYWKADGSVAEFGKATNPSDVSYDMNLGTCFSDGDFFDLLEGEELDQAREAESYLLQRSRSSKYIEASDDEEFQCPRLHK
jgi:hypothetical protein